MTNRNVFTSEEWSDLIDALLLSGLLVVMASPQGALGFAREAGALNAAIQEMLNRGSGLELIEALRHDLMQDAVLQNALKEHLEALAGNPDGADAHLRSQALGHCRRASRTLAEKTSPEEGDYYRLGVLWAGLQVARAAREEGGWLAKDVPPVTDAEREALRQVAFAFGLPADEAVVEQLPEATARLVPGEFAAIFKPDEWALLRQAAVQVGAAVSTAAPSGVLGLARELTALGRGLQEARQRYAGNRLVAAAVDDLMMQAAGGVLAAAPENQEPLTAEKALLQALETCRQVRQILSGRVDAEDDLEFRRMILELGESVAKSSREGGFLGIGGEQVSKEERQALERISAALGLEEAKLE